MVSATTETARVPAGTVTEPPVASSPATVRDTREVSTFAATLKISRYVVTDVSCAVTCTFTTFLPGIRVSAPSISTVESSVVASAVMSTDVTPFSKSNESPLVTSLPSYWKSFRLVSSFGRTFRVTVEVVEVPSSAVTTTVSVFSPSSNSLLPVTATEAAESDARAVTATAVVPAGTYTVVPSVTLAPDTLNTTRELLLEGVWTFSVTS